MIQECWSRPRSRRGASVVKVSGLYYRVAACGRASALLGVLVAVLQRGKFRRYLSLEQAYRYVLHIAAIAEQCPNPLVILGLTSDKDDDYLVALARQARADYLVSGDPHLTKLKDALSPVLTPQAFLDTLGEHHNTSDP